MRWIRAIETEVAALNGYATWTLVKRLPVGTTILRSLWVFYRRRDNKRQVIAHKACLVAQGSQEKKNLYCHDISSP
eukprot:Ihof_evm1s305 gene=Ihof_evmTU1s305